MTIGGSIGLIVLGAILAFAVQFDLQGLSINVIGYILMIGGLIGLVFGLVYTSGRRREIRREPADRVIEER